MARSLLRSQRLLLGLSALGLSALIAASALLGELRGAAAAADERQALTAALAGLAPPAEISLLAAAERYPELALVLRDPTVDSAYKDLLIAWRVGGLAAAHGLAAQRGLLDWRDRVRLTLVLDSPAAAPPLAEELEAVGIVVTGYYGAQIALAVPLEPTDATAGDGSLASVLAALGRLPRVVKLRSPVLAQVADEPLALESIEGLGATVWHAAGITGEGVKVGILDLGFDGYRRLLGRQLPEQVTARSFVLDREPDQSGNTHGTACAEVVHAMAPDADLYLAYYDGSEVSMGRAVDWLLAEGVDVISHSATGLVGPMDGTGMQCSLVDAAAARGVLWVNCMGNYGLSHYRGTYTDDNGNGLHDFAPGHEALAFAATDPSLLLALDWNDWDEVTQDFSLHLYDADGRLLASSQNSQTGGRGDTPFEGIRYNEAHAATYYVAIEAVHATRAVTFDLYVVNGHLDMADAAYSLGTPADSANALAVGATHWRTNQIEDFSSRGPTSDGRLKPDLTAPDAVTVASYAPALFYGTSASAPHVAGAAALLLSAYPGLSRERLIETLTGNAADLGATGPDHTYGYGLLRLPDIRTSYVGATPTALALLPATPTQMVERLVVPTEAASPAPTALPTQPSFGQVIANEDTRLLAVALILTMGIGVLGVAAGALLMVMLLRGRRRRPAAQRMQFAAPPDAPHLLLPDGGAVPLRPGQTTIGRAAENTIVLAAEERVSRHHATITWDGAAASLVDLGSSNGTCVNGVRLRPRTACVLQDGDVIELGQETRLVVRLPWPESPAG